MKKFNWIVWYLLNLITCGVYTFYVWHVMVKNNNTIAVKQGIDTIMGYIPAFLLGCITCGIYAIIWQYKFFKQQIDIAKASSVAVTPTESPFLMFILAFVPFYSLYMVCKNHNDVVDANA